MSDKYVTPADAARTLGVNERKKTDVGKKRVKFKRSVLREAKDVTTSQDLQLSLFDVPLFTPESQVPSNEKTYSVNVIDVT
jgi:hypothetical protein